MINDKIKKYLIKRWNKQYKYANNKILIKKYAKEYWPTLII